MSKDILKKCGGVPLAIITIASALASGHQVKPKHEWDILLQSLGSGLTEDNSLEEMRRILSFSYYNLPSHLKTCLLYLRLQVGRPAGRPHHPASARLIKWAYAGLPHNMQLCQLVQHNFRSYSYVSLSVTASHTTPTITFCTCLVSRILSY